MREQSPVSRSSTTARTGSSRSRAGKRWRATSPIGSTACRPKTPNSLEGCRQAIKEAHVKGPDFQDVLLAQRQIRPYLPRTPLHTYPAIDALIGTEVYIKHENYQ